MDAKDAAPSPISAPIYRPSAEITPAEYEYYMRQAQQMRAETIAHMFDGLFAVLRRLFAPVASPKARPTAERPRHEPVLAKSRTA